MTALSTKAPSPYDAVIPHARVIGAAVILAGFFTGPIHAQAPAPPQDTLRQLSAGKTPGTFAFSYTNRVGFSQESAFPVVVVISDYAQKHFAQLTVSNNQPFTISADLAPGGYWVESTVPPDKAGVYWDSYLDQFFIDPSGIAKSRASSMALMHQKKMTVLSPDPKGTAVVADKRPTLVWQPLSGASSYQVYWLVEPAPHVVASQVHETTATHFQMTEDAIPARRYEWGVMALGPDGRQLGYWSAAYFYTPGGKEAFAKIPEMTSPKKGTPYLGIVPLRLSGMPGHELGILVRSISAGSPALAAGLQPDDILTSFNGKPLAQATVVDFVNLVRAQTAGSVVTLEYMRQGIKMSTKITVGTMP